MWPFKVILLFSASLLVSVLCVPAIKRLVTTLGILDFPDKTDGQKTWRKIHTVPIPNLGGVAIFMGFFCGLTLAGFPTGIMRVYACSLLMFATGLVDDVRQLSPRLRLLIQIGVATLTIWSNHLILPTITLSPTLVIPLPEWMAFAFPVVIIVGAINAVNMIDGLDGLAGGVVMISALLLSILHFSNTEDYQLLLLFPIPLTGAILGFLRYNTYPASIFMGDSGSNWLGFILGLLLVIVMGGYIPAAGSDAARTFIANARQPVPLISAVLCLAIPIFDAANVIWLRWRSGKNPMHADRNHFHHTLLKLGLSHSESVTSIYFIASAIGVMGIFPVIRPDMPALLVMSYLGAIGLALALPILANMNEGLLFNLRETRFSFLHSRNTVVGRRLKKTLRTWESANQLIIYAIFVVTTLIATPVSPEFGYVAGVIAFLLAASALFGHKVTFVESLILTIAAAFLLISNNQGVILVGLMGHLYQLQSFYNASFIVLFVSTICFMLVVFKRKYLVFTPSDFLFIIVPLLLLMAPRLFREELYLSSTCLRSIVIFLALRTLTKRHNKVFGNMRLITVLCLSFVFIKSALAFKIIY